MKQTVDFYDFRRAFRDADRDYYSNGAYEAMFNWYEDLEADTGQEIELDVVAFCGEWTECDSEDLIRDYGYILPFEEWKEESGSDDLDEYTEALAEELGCRAYIVELSDSWLVMEF